MPDTQPPRGSSTVSLPPVRSFLDEHIELRGAVGEAEPWLASWRSLPDALPLPKTVTAFVARPFYRPAASHRCFYQWPGMPAGAGAPSSGRAVLAWKGLEPCAPDFPALLSHLRRPCYSPHNMAEHLALEEQKVPGCLTLAEAIREAERAAAVQAAHVRAYGGLARLPLPLFVFRHSEDTVERTLSLLRHHLSAAVLEVVEPKLQSGLGVYVYHYPSPPMRVRDLDFALQSLAFPQRAAALQSLCDPERVIGRWVSGLARMLYLGFLPATLSSLRTGACCQPQNACLDGGFVDMDSVTPLSDLRDETAVSAGLHFTTESLLRTVRTLVAGSGDAASRERTENRVDLHYLLQHVLFRFRAALESERRPGLDLDPCVSRYFTPAASAAELLARLGTYHAAPSAAFDAASWSFQEIGSAIMAATKD